MSDAAAKNQYSITIADIDRDKLVILNLWAQGFAHLQGATAERKLETQYLHNPAGAAMCFALCADNTQNYAGIQGLVPRQLVDNQVDLRAGLMADYVVDSAHRSLGPALALLRACIDGGIANFDFLYGFPNQKAQAIFKRAGFLPLGQITHYVKLTRSRDFLQKKFRGPWLAVTNTVIDFALQISDWLRYAMQRNKYKWRELNRFDESFDELWEQLRSQQQVMANRSRTMLSWRYPMPSDSYRIFAAFENNSNTLAGYIVWSQRDCEIIVRDFFARPATLGPLLQCFCWRMRQRSASRIALEFFGAAPIAAVLTKSGFRPRGSAPIFILGRTESATAAGGHWYMTSFDRDTD